MNKSIGEASFDIPDIHFPALCVVLFSFWGSGIQKREAEKSIARDPVYTDALITKAVPGTPAPNGIVNLTLDYEFEDGSGNRHTKKNTVTVVKTIEMTQYNVGATVPIVYLRSDPTQNKHTLPSVLK
ncbi:hypothetical protein [Kosakonia cowanii]|jgi:hypothetical protein|uniref:hypothetical protein n=1 Tax=Kosakonia cowanii TaxID=208223 RepID=UPI0027310468|nr:hypothetical protein [Kosakonia cowanii]WKW44337.1 hypothetical protein PZO50_10480 [Kosakonia cowanii]